MKLFRIVCLGFQLLFSLGCQSIQTKEVHLRSQFNKDLYIERLDPIGKNTIKGSAFLKQNNGVIQTCAGNQVGLIPVDDYSSERMASIYGRTDKAFKAHASNWKIKFLPDNPEYGTIPRNTMCNLQGSFSFESVKDGEYFIITNVSWSTSMGGGVLWPEGGTLMQKVNVNGGVVVDVLLTL